MKINLNGFTSLMHEPNPNNTKNKEYIKGVPLGVFESFGKEIIKSDLDCKKEIFEILKESIKKYDSEKLRKEWLNFSKELMKETKSDFRIEIHDLANYVWDNQPTFAKRIELFADWAARDTAFTFWRKKE